MPKRTPRVAVIGAGIAGLTAAWDLAAAGLDVPLFEAGPVPGGKIRQEIVAGRPIDSGPTVVTMRWIFDALFEDHGRNLADHLDLHPLDVLARHAWPGGTDTLDLCADEDRTVEAIRTFAGPAEADGYRRFAARARETFDVLEPTFIHDPAPTVAGLTLAVARKNTRA
jgi:1-hydroxycarotenoid 3,4-desaturase